MLPVQVYGAGYKDLLSSKPGSSGRTMKSVMKALGAPPARSFVPSKCRRLCSDAIPFIPQHPCSMPWSVDQHAETTTQLAL